MGLSQLHEPPFEGTRVLTVGLPKHKVDDVEQMVRDLGGRLLNKCSTSEPPHVLIASDVTSKKYLDVLSVAKTPVLKAEWVYACHKARKQLPYGGFRVPALQGLVICVTGVDQARRPGVQATVEAAGGKYTKDLVRGTTHLIAVNTQSPKYERAVTWKSTHVVSLQWLYDSVQSKARLSEHKYPVQPTSAEEQAAAMRAAAGAGRDAEATAVNHRGGRRGNACKANKGGAAALNSLRIFCLGLDGEERRRAVDLSRQLGAARFEHFDESVTHVVCGGGRGGLLDPNLVSRVADHVRAGPGTLATLEWLGECKLHASVVALTEPPERLLASLERRCSSSAAAATGTEGPRPSSRGGGDGGDEESARHGTRSERKGVLGGRRFWQHSLSDEDAERAREMVERGGGSWEGGLPRGAAPPKLGRGDHVVFPAWCDRIPSGVPANRRVTCRWLSRCLEGDRPPKDPSILDRPLPMRCPLEGFDKVSLCASQYSSKEREVLYELVSVLGGGHDDALRRDRTTHLVIPEAAGAKHAKCEKWGIHAVTASWLLESAKMGRRLPESNFVPQAPKLRAAKAPSDGRRPGLGEVPSKGVVFSKTEVRVTGTQGGCARSSEPAAAFSPRRQTRSSLAPAAKDRTSPSLHTLKGYSKVSRRAKASASAKAAPSRGSAGSSPMRDVVTAIDRIEGIISSHHSKPILGQRRTRSRAQAERVRQGKGADPSSGEDAGGEDFESSQRVTYAPEGGNGAKQRKLRHPPSGDGDFTKRLLGRAVATGKRRKTDEQDDLKDFGLI